MPDDFDDRAYCEHSGEVRLDDADLRDVINTPGAWTPPLAREVLDLRARVAKSVADAALAAVCRPPEIRDRPTDTDLSGLVSALEGTGDPLHVLGSELLDARGRIAELEERLKPFEPNPERVAESFRRVDELVDRCRTRRDEGWADEDALRTCIAELEAQQDRVADLFEKWAAEESKWRDLGENGRAASLKTASDMLRGALTPPSVGEVDGRG